MVDVTDVRILNYMQSCRKAGEECVNVFDIMYEFSKPYADIKRYMDKLVLIEAVVCRDIKTYALTENSEEKMQILWGGGSDSDRRSAVQKLCGTLSAIAEADDGLRPVEKNEAYSSPLKEMEARFKRLNQTLDDYLANSEARKAMDEKRPIYNLIDEEDDDDDDDDGDEDPFKALEDYLWKDDGDEDGEEEDEEDEEEDNDYPDLYNDRYYLKTRERYAMRFIMTLRSAFALAPVYKTHYIAPEHILFAVLTGFSSARQILRDGGIEVKAYREAFMKRVDKDYRTGGLTGTAEEILTRADFIANDLSGEGAKTTDEHFVIALLRDRENEGYRILKELGVDTQKLIDELTEAVRPK